MYLGTGAVASTFGAAGSLIALLLWVYYSAQIFFFGAELTRHYALEFGSLQHARDSREVLPVRGLCTVSHRSRGPSRDSMDDPISRGRE